MIEITLTLFAQAAHFGIAYVLLRYIFLHPAWVLMMQRDVEKAALKKRIMVARNRVSHQKRLKDEHQARCQVTFAQALNHIQELQKQRMTMGAQVVDPAPIVFDPQLLQRAREQARTMIVTEVERYG